MIYKALAVICVFALTYATFSFVVWDFNPATWHQDLRYLFAFTSIGCSIAALMAMQIK